MLKKAKFDLWWPVVTWPFFDLTYKMTKVVLSWFMTLFPKTLTACRYMAQEPSQMGVFKHPPPGPARSAPSTGPARLRLRGPIVANWPQIIRRIGGTYGQCPKHISCRKVQWLNCPAHARPLVIESSDRFASAEHPLWPTCIQHVYCIPSQIIDMTRYRVGQGLCVPGLGQYDHWHTQPLVTMMIMTLWPTYTYVSWKLRTWKCVLIWPLLDNMNTGLCENIPSTANWPQ